MWARTRGAYAARREPGPGPWCHLCPLNAFRFLGPDGQMQGSLGGGCFIYLEQRRVPKGRSNLHFHLVGHTRTRTKYRTSTALDGTDAHLTDMI